MLGGDFEVNSRLFGVILCSKRGLEVGCRAVEHFRLPASTVNTFGIGSQLSKYWNIYWRLVSSLSIGRIYGIFLDFLNSNVRTARHEQLDTSEMVWHCAAQPVAFLSLAIRTTPTAYVISVAASIRRTWLNS